MTEVKIQKDWKKELWSYCLLILGSALFAVGDVMFVNPYHLAPGGVYGLANVFNALWGWKISLAGVCMDIPLLIIGTIILGPKFGVKTVVSVILIPVFTFILETTWGYAPVIHDGPFLDVQEHTTALYYMQDGVERWFMPDMFLNTVVAGLIYGVAIGVIFRAGATSGGSDIISMIIHKYTKISLGTLVLIVDSCISLTTLIAFQDPRLPIYSIILIFIESKIIDMVVDGMKSYKTMFIVTDEVEAVRDYILNDLQRGGTLLVGTGLYQGNERKMIYVTLDRADMVKLKSSLHRIDPKAFVNIMESSEILGFGFKALPKD
ncbi:MAG: YitT family protein [Bacteroidales bacterium]|nr:YitT family protein [Bacteroidales bacterium]